MNKISIVVPCYNEGPVLRLFYKELITVLHGMQGAVYEIIFVDDGSTDDTLAVMKELHKEDKQVRYISFSRNFGKEAGLFAGLQAATGDFVAVMDADLQDPPAMLPSMYEELLKGEVDCVGTRRVTRKGEPPIRSFFARLFYKLINRISDANIVDGARDFRLMNRPMLRAVLSVREYNRFSKGIFGWVGFKTKWLEYENVERAAGETKWSFWKLLLYSMDGIVAFSTAPLAISSVLGFLLFLGSLFMVLYVVVKTLLFGEVVAGYPTTICLICMLSGVQLLSVGILGQYLSKTYMETKQRPLYIVRETETDPFEVQANG
ncbi:glycosyltransferase family 2 protein [Ruminococcaceae bacterium OttesenSCG-928-N02]|nr:glycosyltransferase family 2 protein [Ruminococcaceae bacterium OttesenSCG-928-N02]